MKKILIILFISLLYVNMSFAGNCTYNEEYSISTSIDLCLSDTTGSTGKGVGLVTGMDVKLESNGGFARQINIWTKNIALYLGVFAVGSIVFGGLMLTLSAGEEEKVKKAKDIIKWGLIGFIGLISVSAIIGLIVKIMYSI